jgi:hypothetical protein
MSLKVEVKYIVGKTRLNMRSFLKEIPTQTIEVSYDGTISGFDYDYELAYTVMSGQERDDRFLFVEDFRRDNFHGLFDSSYYKRYFCQAIVDQGVEAFVGDANISQDDESDLLVAMLWYIHNYMPSAEERGDEIAKRLVEVWKPGHDMIDLTYSVESAHTEEPFTHFVRIRYELEVNGDVVGAFDRYARKSTHDPVEVETYFELDEIDYIPSYAWKLIDLLEIKIPDAVGPDDIVDPVELPTNDSGAFFVIYSDAEDEVSLEDAAKVRRFLGVINAMEAVRIFQWMSENLDSPENAQYKVTLARLDRASTSGVVQTSDLTLIRTWYYDVPENRYSGHWETVEYGASGHGIPELDND